jgi:multimeric flavodoxin WrbA
MYAVAVNGSPRQNGNTATLLTRALEPLQAAGWDTELIQVGGKDIQGCTACGECWQNKDMKCIFDHDLFNQVMESLVQAQALIFGSPTYFSDVSPELKALLDRSGFVALANGRAFAGKIGAAVVAVRRGGGIHAFDTINHMFLMSQMIVPGSTYWNLGYGLDEGEVVSDQEGLANMQNLGRTIAWLGQAMQSHKDSFPSA